MSHSVLSIFEEECTEVEFNSAFVKSVDRYLRSFVNKNEDNVYFFGGNLLGVQVVRFKDTDRDLWFDEILKAYETPLKERLHKLPTVNKNWKVSSDTMNLSCLWLAHKTLNSDLNDKDKLHTMVNIFIVLQIKYLTSLLSNYFKYPADKGVAEATYAALSYKFAIKQYGTWYALLEGWATKLATKDGLHYNTVLKMNDDSAIVYFLNDTQGRIRDQFKNIYAVHKNLSDNKIRIATTSNVVSYDGEAILKDKSQNLLSYTRYLNEVVSDRNSFMKEELLVIIEKIMHTMPVRLFRETLEWMSINYRQNSAAVIEEALEECVLHSFDYLSQHKELLRSNVNLTDLLTRLRGAYMSSRSVDEALIQLRAKMEIIVRNATQTKNDSLVSSIRTGCLLYLILRTYTKKHYSTTF